MPAHKGNLRTWNCTPAVNVTTRYSSPAIPRPRPVGWNAGKGAFQEVSHGGNYGHASRAPRVSSHPSCAGCGSRSIPRARPSKMAGGFFSPVPFRVLLRFFSPVPFRVWAAKKRNEVPQWNPLKKQKHGWNDNGLLFQIQDNGRSPFGA